MARRPELVTAPAEEPVSIVELKDHLAVTDSSFDSYVRMIGVAAREHVEQTTWRALVTQTWDQFFDCFGDPMCLRMPPLATGNGITSVKYTAIDGTQKTVSSSIYETGNEDGIPSVRLAYNQTWPSDIRGHPDSVVIRTIMGYGSTAGTADDVPEPLRHAIKLLAGDLYENRESIVTGQTVNNLPTLKSLLAPYNVRH